MLKLKNNIEYLEKEHLFKDDTLILPTMYFIYSTKKKGIFRTKYKLETCIVPLYQVEHVLGGFRYIGDIIFDFEITLHRVMLCHKSFDYIHESNETYPADFLIRKSFKVLVNGSYFY